MVDYSLIAQQKQHDAMLRLGFNTYTNSIVQPTRTATGRNGQPVTVLTNPKATPFYAARGAAPAQQSALPPVNIRNTPGVQVRVDADTFAVTKASPPRAAEIPAIDRQSFNSTEYLKANPDVAAAGADPYTHYRNFGIRENRQLTTAIRDMGRNERISGASGLSDTLGNLGAARIASKVGTFALNAGSSLYGAEVAASSVYGPVQASSLSSGLTAIGSTLGPAAIGFAVGSLNPFTDNNKQSQAGGTAGAVAGSLVLPGIGTAIGAVAGSLLGGLIGPGRQHPASTAGFVLGTEGGASDFNALSKHTDTSFGEAVAGEAAGLAKALGELGVRFNNTSLHGGIDDGRGFIAFGKDLNDGGAKFARQFDTSDQRSISNTVSRAVLEAVNLNAIENDGLRNYIANLDVGTMTAGEIIDSVTLAVSVVGGSSNNVDVVAATQIIPDPTARQRITAKVTAARAQMDDFLDKVKKGTVGKAATILTGPRGILDPIEGIKPMLGGISTEPKTILGV